MAITAWVCVNNCLFPEIQYDKIDKVRGMAVTIVTTAKTDEEGRRAAGRCWVCRSRNRFGRHGWPMYRHVGR